MSTHLSCALADRETGGGRPRPYGRTRGRSAALLGVVALALASAACSRPSGPPRRPPLPAGEAERGGPAFLPPSATVDEPPTAATHLATVTGVRSATHGEFDRVVFELAGDLPGYRVAWAGAPPHQCGSGEATSIPGNAWLTVRLDPAQAHDEQGRVTVDRLTDRPALPAIQALALTCDFEGVVGWAVGAPVQLPYRVLPLSDPPRLVVDVAHP